MEVVLIRDGKFWRHDGQRIKYGEVQNQPDGWSYILQQRNRTFWAEVYKDEELQYKRKISSERLILLLLTDGMVDLARLSESHIRLAYFVNRALVKRRAVDDSIVARVEYVSSIPGTTFRIAPGTRNSFSDGPPFRIVRNEGTRIAMICVGGTYLVRTSRHDTGVIFAVKVFVQSGYNEDGLFEELSTLV